jgi:sugar phosphate isomerase/epimerase
MPFEEWILYLRPQNHIHFHLHDNRGTRDTHLPLGDGNIDWFRVKQYLQALTVNFSIALEPHSKEDMFKSIKFYNKFFLNK